MTNSVHLYMVKRDVKMLGLGRWGEAEGNEEGRMSNAE